MLLYFTSHRWRQICIPHNIYHGKLVDEGVRNYESPCNLEFWQYGQPQATKHMYIMRKKMERSKQVEFTVDVDLKSPRGSQKFLKQWKNKQARGEKVKLSFCRIGEVAT